MRFSVIIAPVLAAALLAPVPALAWGAVGHRMINNSAMRSLPSTIPAFVTTPEAIAEITMLAPEADRLRDAGKIFYSDYAPEHFLDAGDDGKLAGVVSIADLPPNREAYDTALRKGSPVNGAAPDEYSVGLLPYSIADGYEQIEEDFGIWRIDTYGEAHATSADEKAAFAADRKLREILTIRDIGYVGHFVGDGSQPLHDTVHFNGWGDYPNPNNYTQSKQFHSKFETAFVNAHESVDTVMPLIGPYTPNATPILTRVGAYLLKTSGYVPDVYKLEQAGAIDSATPQAVAFTAQRLADGARMLRDLVADAYTNSVDMKIGYPGVLVRDVESGKVVPVPYSSFKG
jgi:hypothetical protein